MPNTGMSVSRNRADGGDGVVAGLRVARAVTQENTIRIHRKYLICRRLCRHHRHAAAVLGEDAQNVALDAEVVGDDVQAALRTRRLGRRRPRPCRRSTGRCFLVETTLARSMPFKPGNFFAARTAALSSMFSPVMMQPACAPFSRSSRVSLRVSMSAIATTLQRCRKLAERLGRAPVRVQQRQVADDEAGGDRPRRTRDPRGWCRCCRCGDRSG